MEDGVSTVTGLNVQQSVVEGFRQGPGPATTLLLQPLELAVRETTRKLGNATQINVELIVLTKWVDMITEER